MTPKPPYKPPTTPRKAGGAPAEEPEAMTIEEEIDDAVEDTFPASDPPSTSTPSRRKREKE